MILAETSYKKSVVIGETFKFGFCTYTVNIIKSTQDLSFSINFKLCK
jgi:hypothetical protein